MEQQQHTWQDNLRQRWSIAIALVIFVALSRLNFPDPLRAVPYSVVFFGFIGYVVVRELYLWRQRVHERRDSEAKPPQ
jgi:hypothetical protein